MKARHQPWADLAVFEDLAAGQAVEAFLRGKGFESQTYDDKFFRWFLFLRPPRITYRVQVHGEDLKSADYMLEATAGDLLRSAIHCPECHSLRIQYPQMTRKFFLPTVLLHLGIIFRIVDHECYCEHCHFTWNLPGEHAQPVAQPAPHA
jgi:hypothetical protein